MKNIPRTKDYSTLPNLSAASGLTLSESIASAAAAAWKNAAPTLVTKALGKLATQRQTLSDAWEQHPDNQETTDVRPVDNRVDRSWGAVYRRLKEYDRLHGDHPDIARAAELIAQIFPDGLSFLNDEFHVQWAECEKRMNVITNQGLAGDLRRLAGDLFVQQMVESYKEYGQALKVTEADEPAEATELSEEDINLRKLLKRLTNAIFNFTDKAIGHMDEDDPASIQLTRSVLTPIDTLREKAKQRRQRKTASHTPDTTSS